MKNKIFLSLLVLFSIFIANQHSYSYHVLNQASGASNFVFFNLPSMPVDFRVDGGTLGGGNGLTTVEAGLCRVGRIRKYWKFLRNIDPKPNRYYICKL